MPSAKDRRKITASFLKSRGGKKKKRNKAIRPKTGKLIERKYGIEIKSLLKPMFKAIQHQLVPALIQIKSQADQDLRIDQSYSEIITNVFNGVRLTVAGTIPDASIQDLVDKNGQKINSFSGAQTDASFKSVLAVAPVRAEPYLASQLSAFSHTNTALIRSIPTKYLDDVETIVRIGINRGQSLTEISKNITAKTQAAKKRADLIARDQVQKFNGKLNELRQIEVGVTKYIWSTSNDPSVRDEHAGRDGKVFEWANPPEDGHPGEAINCRCSAIPVMDELIVELDQAA